MGERRKLRTASRAGFTLLEVVLAIGLSGTLLALLALAINLHLLRVDASRSTVEEAQLARGVLRMVVDDLRNGAVLYEQDTSAAEQAASAAESFDVEEEVDMSAEEIAEEEAVSESLRPYVGVRGDLESIQIDVHRVRPVFVASTDERDPTLAMSLASPGIATVRYFLTDEGLNRQEVARDRHIWEEAHGSTAAWEESTRVVAPEVRDLRFRYHDGTTALEYWDLDEQQGALPLAVEVRVGIQTLQADTDAEEEQEATIRYYRLTAPIRAPVAAASAATAEGESP